VLAQAFREQAVRLKAAAAPSQQSVAPLSRVQPRILQQARFREMFRRAAEMTPPNQPARIFLRNLKETGRATSQPMKPKPSASCGIE